MSTDPPRTRERVSIRAPVKGATTGRGRGCRISGGFNPRPREGGDLMHIASPAVMPGFNPRPREGGDLGGCCACERADEFQSAPP